MLARRRFLGKLGLLALGLAGCERQAPALALPLGAAWPEVALLTAEGRPFTLAAGGAPLLVNFWATWCPPCRAEMAGLERLHRAFSPRGLQVLGISVDADVFLVREYLLQEGLTFPVLLDADGQAARQRFLVPAYPTTCLVGRDGRLAASWIGERDWDAAEMRDAVGRLL